MPSHVHKNQRYIALDAIRIICAFGVITIHAAFPGNLGIYVQALSRISVPVFFMISGFFYHRNDSADRMFQQIKKLFILFLFSNILYLLWNLLLAILSGNNPLVLITNYISPIPLIKLFFFQSSPVVSHLWYLGASAVVWCLILTANKLHLFSLLKKVWPFLLIINLICGVYSPLLFGVQIPPIITRNAYFTGLPFFMMGFFFHEQYDAIKKRLSQNHLLSFSLLFLITSLAEKWILLNYCNDPMGDLYISTIFFSAALFLYFAAMESDSKVMRTLSVLGRNLSLYVYLLHVLIGDFLRILSSFYPIQHYWKPIYPIVVFVLSVFLSIAALRLHKTIRRFILKDSCI